MGRDGRLCPFSGRSPAGEKAHRRKKLWERGAKLWEGLEEKRRLSFGEGGGWGVLGGLGGFWGGFFVRVGGWFLKFLGG